MEFSNHPAKDVRDILAKYKTNKNTWLDEIDSAE
jgi:hypothetical protein